MREQLPVYNILNKRKYNSEQYQQAITHNEQTRYYQSSISFKVLAALVSL